MQPPRNNVEWMKRAFLQVKGALMAEIVAESGEFVTEDFVRGSLLRGLMLSNPQAACRVKAESPAWWTGNPDLKGTGKKASGSPVRHDVAVEGLASDPGLVCEVKWLKQAKPKESAMDLWKVVMSRSTGPEKSAIRTFLVTGGDTTAFSKTRKKLTREGLYMPWAPQGRGAGSIKPRTLALDKGLANGGLLFEAWRDVVRWGSSKKGYCYRTPPGTWAKVRLKMRDRWWETTAGRSWALVLWEVDHGGPDVGSSKIVWTGISSGLP